MLKFIFTDVDDKEIIISDCVSLNVNMEESVPAHDLSVTFLYRDVPEFVSITMLSETQVLFTGIVDEQIRECSVKGDFLKLHCRSMAAKLLDNESMPISYTHPSVDVILKNHVKPFSVYCENTNDDTYFGTQTVGKGSTNWQAVEDFSKNMYHSMPCVSELGLLYFENPNKDVTTVFSNLGDGVKFQKFCEQKKRCEEISKIRIKAVNSGGYHMLVENKDACDRKIQRERYLNAVFTNTPAIYAENMIKNSRKKAYTVTLSCVGCQISAFLSNAIVRLSKDVTLDSLYVSAVRYNLSTNGDITTLTLKRKEV